MPNFDQVINNLKALLDSQQLSLIAKNFYFTLIENKKGNSCGTTKYEWRFKKLLNLNNDEYKKGGALSLNDI